MFCRDIMDIIEKRYPREYAMEWDNVGLLAGRDDKEIHRIYIAVDATDEVIDAAIAIHADMLVTHHPMIFESMRQINNRDFIGKRIIKLIQNDISYYAMHTNYDVLGMSELSAKLLELKNAQVLETTYCSDHAGEHKMEGIGRIADLSQPVSLGSYCNQVKKIFQLEYVKLFGNPDMIIRRVAICPGSGKSVIQTALEKQADVLVTGDIGHHEGIDAVAQDLAIIDAGHYGIESIFINDMQQYLTENLNGIEVTGAPIHHPFMIV